VLQVGWVLDRNAFCTIYNQIQSHVLTFITLRRKDKHSLGKDCWSFPLWCCSLDFSFWNKASTLRPKISQ
jgi:hypothetical protein